LIIYNATGATTSNSLPLQVQCVMPDQEEFFQDVSDVSWIMGMLLKAANLWIEND
jgi:hypothetical protein